MKEFRSKNSGRYIFNEDMHNLQELALSPVEMYKDSGLDFVLSGCIISITEQNGIFTVGITSGYVFLDNKIRKVAAFSGTTSDVNTIGIYATQPTAPQITYKNGDTDYMYNDYEAEFKVNYNNIGNIANLQAVYDGDDYVFPNLRTGYFAHYALVNDGTVGHYPLLQGDRIVGTIGEFGSIKIGNAAIGSLFVSKSGDTMNAGATLTFGSTVIGETSIVVDGDLQAEGGVFNDDVTIDGDVTAASFVKKNGTSSQFLKADGSVDTTNYATNASLANYLLLTGGTITGDLAVNENLQVNKNCIVSRDLTIQGQINAVGGTLTGNLEVLGLKASNAEVTNILEVGGLDVSGIGNVDGTLDVGGAFTTQSIATIGGDTIINGQITSTKFVRVNGTSAQFLKANGDIDGNTYALASSLNNYLLLAGGTITGNLTCNAKVTANSFVKADGTASQFLKADGTIDANVYATVSQLSNYALASSLSNYLLLSGGTLSGSITSPSFIKNGGTSNQFLKADGSVDNNSYLPLTGGTLSGQITSTSFIKSGGTSSQFLKADGSVDSNSYPPLNQNGGIEISEAKITDELVIGVTGYRTTIASDDGGCRFVCGNLNFDFDAEVNAPAFRKNGGLASQFLKADGSVDSNNYVPFSASNTIEIGKIIVDGELVVGDGDYCVATITADQDGLCFTGGTPGYHFDHEINAPKFSKYAGLSTQFLKADGSVDSNSYVPFSASGTIEISKVIGIDELSIGSSHYRTKIFSDDSGCFFRGANLNYDFDEDIVAPSFVKDGGLATQFLKADGSVDSNSYVPFSASNTIETSKIIADDELLVGSSHYRTKIFSDDSGCFFRGANLGYDFDEAITAPSFIKDGGLATQFLKADGSVDSNSYVPLSANNTIEINRIKVADALEIGSVTYRTTIISDDTGCKFRGANFEYIFDASVSASSFVKENGTSAQFLKADGSVDSNSYVTLSANNTIEISKIKVANELELGPASYKTTIVSNDSGCFFRGANLGYDFDESITAPSFIKENGTSAQFLKADGSVDSNAYVPLLANNTIEIDRINAVNQLGLGSVSYRTTIVSDDSGCRFRGANFNYDFDENIVAPAFVKENGTSSQFLKADGSVDSNSYVPFSASNTIEINKIKVENELELGPVSYKTTIISDDTGCKFIGANLEYNFDEDVSVDGTVTATSFPTSSDSRLKNQIGEALLTAEQIADAPSIKFTWNNEKNSDKVFVGSIAQYWQEVLPEVVNVKNEYLTLDYGTAAMVSVINLAKEVVALKKEIEKLKS